MSHIALGGTRLGSVIRLLIYMLGWIAAVAEVDDNEVGRAALEGIGSDGGRFSVSVAFDPDPGGMVRWAADPLSGNLPGVQRTRVKLLDIAIVDRAQYEGAYTYARGPLTSLATEMAAA